MRKANGNYLLSPTDLSNFLGCKHVMQLDRQMANGTLEKPPYYKDLTLETLQQLGLRHEEAYVEHLRAQGKEVCDLREIDEGSLLKRTQKAMAEGKDIIVQAELSNGHWKGRADLLIRKENEETGDSWYEVADTKLAKETRAGTILQLCVYSDLLEQMQGRKPQHFYVVKPGDPFEKESYRFDDFAAYYRLVKRQMEEAVADPGYDTYPDPVAMCDICRWRHHCEDRRRADDHLRYVAGLGHTHQVELESQGIGTLTDFARREEPLDKKPVHGSQETYEKLHRQAEIQLEGREKEEKLYRLMEAAEGDGLARLPEPDAGDVFFDIESARYYRNGEGLEFLFGVAWMEDGELQYRHWWAQDWKGEKTAFEELMDFLTRRWELHPGMHVYHYASYEPAALKRLMLRHNTRMEELDRFLRAERFIDLQKVLRQSLIASVESYGLKEMEPFYKYKREMPLEEADFGLRTLQAKLELGVDEEITEREQEVVIAYNRDDCDSTYKNILAYSQFIYCFY